MRKYISYFALFFVTIGLFSSFKYNTVQTVNPPTEFEQLVQYLEAQGNFINSDHAPALVSATEIKENLKNEAYLVIDIRSAAWFEYGHIKNAVNVKGPDLLNYFLNDIQPENYDKISIVCYSGQSAAYYASLLRLYGFDNAYSMKFGMSSWHEEFAANVWVKNAKNDFAEQLESTVNAMPEIGQAPVLNTGKSTAEDILKLRVTEAFAKPYKEFIVKSADVFATPSDYFVMHYVPEEIYTYGHIPGAVQYSPKTLDVNTNLMTLPTDKKVVVNCMTGQSAAYVVAYLHVLGYDVGNLAYGANSYMNATLVEKDWKGFSEKEIKNYPIVE